ncbi:hypothetical protein [Rubrivirga sp. IMCC45206]|uniref:hypothetical protein n=1 Tax=Rubrivirga sp. IMCC45206 TaxID=3391614 RepID=UPI00398FB7DF
MRLRSSFAALLLSLVALGCDAGPEGPAGPAGPEGPVGPQGSASVVATTFAYSAASCQRSGEVLFCAEPWAALTSDFVDDGAVFAYRRATNGGWIALPSTERLDIDLDGTPELVEFGYRYVPEQISLRIAVLESTTPFVGLNTPGEVRAVAIAGSAGARRSTPPAYADLAHAYGLPLD